MRQTERPPRTSRERAALPASYECLAFVRLALREELGAPRMLGASPRSVGVYLRFSRTAQNAAIVLSIEQSEQDTEARPILVTGMHRSGTTWLGQMLCASGALINVHEPLKPTNRRTIFHSCVERWYTYISAENEGEYLRFYRDAIAFRPHPLDDIRRMRSPRDSFRMTSRWLSYALGRAQRRRLLLKDPFAIFSVEWFARTLPCDVVIIVRHPAATVSSLKRLGYIFDLNDLLDQPLLINERLLHFRPELEAAVEFPEDVVGQGSLLWKMIYDLASHYGAGDRRVHLVRHEDLSVNPQEQFAALYDRLHLPLTARAQHTIARFTSDRNPSEVPRANPVVAPLDSRRNVSNWMHRLQPEEIARIRRITQDVWPRYYTDDEWSPRAGEHG